MLVRVTDIETTGLKAERDGIVNVAWADFDTKTGKIWNAQDFICDPGHPIPPGASSIHQLTDADVAGKPHAREFMEDLFRGPEIMVSYNKDFERDFFTRACGGTLPQKKWLCGLRFARHMFYHIDNHKLQTIRYHLKIDNIPELFARTSHQALADVYVTARIIESMLELAEGHYTDLDDLIEQIEPATLLHHCTWGKFMGEPWETIPSGALAHFRDRNFCKDVTYTCKYWLRKRGQG